MAINERSRHERAVLSSTPGPFAAVQDSIERLRPSLSSALIVALFSPLGVLQSRAVQRILLATVLLDIPFQFGTHLFYSEEEAATGALSGLSISATTIALAGLYFSWFLTSFVSRNRSVRRRHILYLHIVLLLAFCAVSVLVDSDDSLDLCWLFFGLQLTCVLFF